MDFYEFGKELSYIGSQLQTIRNLSKGKAIDFTNPPYDNDTHLIQHLLDKEIIHGLDERKQEKTLEKGVGKIENAIL